MSPSLLAAALLLAAPAARAATALESLRAGAGPAPAAAAAPAGAPEPSAELLVRVFGGDRRPFPEGEPVLLRVLDGNGRELVSTFVRSPRVRIKGLPVRGNSADDYRAIVSAKGHKDAGFYPVRLMAAGADTLDLLLVPQDARFDFSRAGWEAIKASRPHLLHMLMDAPGPDAGELSEAEARARYERLMREKPESLACLLNITTAMDRIVMPSGRSALSYFHEFVWDERMAKDRFFAYAEYGLLRQTRLGEARGQFGKEANPGVFHKGAFTSFKQLEFGEANVQLTFHHDETHVHASGEGRHVLMEPDIDLYKDLLAHGLLEVIPGYFSLTDPRDVYQLRWMAGRRAGEPEFDPLYSLVR